MAMLGHELRNPLAPILTALQLMHLRGVTGAERERAIIERQVKHVVGLVDDLLDISRITRGKVHLRIEAVDLADIVAKAIEMTSPAIEERHHTLAVDVPAGLPLDADPARLGQVVANLLTNAAKYTEPHGLIRVAAERTGASIVLRVSDNGRGIPADVLPHVFDLFVQERQNLERSQGGLGIGLAIVRSLVQAHGGSVEAASAGAGRGSTFTVTLPARAAKAPAPAESPTPIARETAGSARILIVDDNQDAARLLADSLHALGHVVQVAHDGPSALEAAAIFRPDIALLDLGASRDGRLRARSAAARRSRAGPCGARRRHRLRAGSGSPAHVRRGFRRASGETGRRPRAGPADSVPEAAVTLRDVSADACAFGVP